MPGLRPTDAPALWNLSDLSATWQALNQRTTGHLSHLASDWHSVYANTSNNQMVRTETCVGQVGKLHRANNFAYIAARWTGNLCFKLPVSAESDYG